MARPRVEHSYYVRKRGRNWVGIWHVRSAEGERIKHQRVIGLRSEITKTEAMNRQGKWVRENVPAFGVIKENPTLLEIWQRFLSSANDKVSRGKRNKQYATTRKGLWLHLEPLALLPALDITPEQIERLFDNATNRRTSEPLSAESKSGIRNLARQLLKTVGNNAVGEAEMRFTGKQKGETLSAEQIRAIRQQLAGRDLVIFDVLAFVGLRAIEARRLARVHLQVPGMINVPGSKTKLSSAFVPVPAELYAQLLDMAAVGVNDNDPILFEQQSHRTWLESVLQKAAGRAGIKHVVDMRGMRRSTLTHTAKQDRGAASRLGRHKDARMIDTVYDNPDLDRVKVAQDAFFKEITAPVVN